MAASDDASVSALIKAHVVAAVFQEAGSAAEEVKIEESKGPTGGFSGEMRKYTITLGDAAHERKREATVVMKHFPEHRLASSKGLGLAREGIFYAWATKTDGGAPVRVASMLKSFIAKCFYSHGDLSTGEKIMIMEDLSTSCVSCSSLYGHASPVNWGKDAAVVADIRKVYAAQVAEGKAPATEDFPAQQLHTEKLCSHLIAEMAAKFHALYWHEPDTVAARDTSGLPDAWMRGPWFKNANPATPADTGREAWQAGLSYSIGEWRKFQSTVLADGKVKVDPRMLELMERAITDTTWEQYVEDMRRRSWTLVHGDFHPGNMLWRLNPAEDQSRVVLLDWEVVGFGNGPQEIAQALISHAAPAVRRQYEREVLDTYIAELQKSVGTTLNRAAVEDDYKCCGLGRWLWLMGVCSVVCPPPMMQYFHDQVLAFCMDHQLFDVRATLPVLLRP